MAFTRLLVSFAAVSTIAEGARISKKRQSSKQPETKFIAGVPVTNYQLAYTSETSFAEVDGVQPKQDWTVVVDTVTSDEEIHSLCQLGECKGEGHPSEGGVPFFEVRATEEELEKLIQTSNGAVKFVEPDSAVSLYPVEVKPQAATWGLNRIRHSQRRASGRGVDVYILDTGIRTSHNEFRGRAEPTLDMTQGRREVCSRFSSTCARDRQGHGTHCAGTAAGARYGVAPAARLRAVKVLGDNGSGQFSWAIEALDYIATRGGRSRVASMSLGAATVVQAMRAAVDAAVGVGVIVVVAAGNDNHDACRNSPAFVSSALTIGSTDSRDRRSGFSNFGRCVNLWAPGSGVLSAFSSSDSATRTLSGTSMACPHVSGAAALILERNPRYNTHQVHQRIRSVTENGVIQGLKPGDTNRFLRVVGL